MTTSRSGLRRSVRAVKDAKGDSAAKGWSGSWRNRLDIPKDTSVDIILTRGTYANPYDLDADGEARPAHFHTEKMHQAKYRDKSGKEKFQMWRCALDVNPDADCLGCKLKAEGDSRLATREMFSFNLLHLDLYEQTAVIGRDGRPLLFEEGEKRGQPVMQWTAVDKPSRRRQIEANIHELLAAGTVQVFRKKYVQVGSGHRDALTAIDEKANDLCNCGGDLFPASFICPFCEHVLADVEKDDMSEKEIQSWMNNRKKCPHCRQTGYPEVTFGCSQCDTPSPLTAFDVVATIRKVGQGAQSQIQIEKIVPLDKYTLPGGISLIEWDTAKDGTAYPRIDKETGGFVLTEDFDVAKATTQWNFDTIHAPKPNAEIATMLGVKNPFRETGADKYRGMPRTATDGTDDEDSAGEEEVPAARQQRRRSSRF